MGAVDELRRKRFALEPIAKRARKVLGESLRQRRVLNASLMQQSKTGAPLRRAGDLAAITDYVGADGVCETMLGNFWRRRGREDCFHAAGLERLANGVVHIGINC